MVSLASRQARGRSRTGLPAAFFRILVVLLLLATLEAAPAQAQIVLSDAAGRTVTLAKPARRIVTNESLILLSLALVDADPVARFAGWAAPQRIDRGMYEAYRRRFPAIDRVPTVGSVLPAKTSVEAVLSVKPDLFVVSIWETGWAEVATTLEAAGVPVLFLDGPVNDGKGPGETTAFSVELLAEAVGQAEEGKSFGDFVRARYKRITDRTAGLEPVSVLLDAHAGATCCATPGKGNRITEYLRFAGGRNIGADLPGYDGLLSSEYVLDADPTVYIATGGPHLAAQGGLVLGGGVSVAAAQTSLAAIFASDMRNALTAVREGRAHAVSHQLSISVLNILIFECFAKWMHPAIFVDVDPAQTLAEINKRFLAVPLEGTFWVDFQP